MIGGNLGSLLYGDVFRNDIIIQSYIVIHYDNTFMQFFAILNDNFQMKNCDIFLIFAQNIDREYTLEPPNKNKGIPL